MSGSTLSMFSIQQPGGNVKRSTAPYKCYKSYNFYSFTAPSGRLDGPGGGVHFVGIVGIVAGGGCRRLHPLALSRFLRRGAVPACKNRSAAPGCGALLLLRASQRPRKRQTAAPALLRLFRPLDAPQLRSQRRLPASSTGRGRRRCPGGGVHFVGIVGIVAFGPVKRARARTSPERRGRSPARRRPGRRPGCARPPAPAPRKAPGPARPKRRTPPG